MVGNKDLLGSQSKATKYTLHIGLNDKNTYKQQTGNYSRKYLLIDTNKKIWEGKTMSKENVQKFYASIEDDEKTNQEVLEAAAAGNIVEYAKKKGFEFTKEEYDEFISQISTDTSEIPDDQLDKVAGGVHWPPVHIIPQIKVICKQCGWDSGWKDINGYYNYSMLTGLHLAKTGHTKYKAKYRG